MNYRHQIIKLLPLVIACSFAFVAPHMITPFLSFQVKHLGGGKFLSSSIFSVAAIASLFCSPFWGWLSDCYGRRRMLLLSGVLTSMTLLWFGFASSLLSLFLARACFGVVSNWMVVAAAAVSDMTSRGNRSLGMAIFGVAIGFGFMLGAMLSSSLAFLGIKKVCIIASIVSLCALLFIWLAKLEFAPPHRNTHFSRVMSDSGFLWLLFMYAACDVVFVGFESVFSVWGMDVLQFTSVDVGHYYSWIGLVMIVVQLAFPWILRKFHDHSLAFWPFIGFGSALFALCLSPSRYQLYFILALFSASSGLSGPVLQGFLSQCVAEEDVGSAMGFAHSASLIAMALAPMIVGWLYMKNGFVWAFGFLIAFCVLVFVLGYYLFVKRKMYVGRIAESRKYMDS